MSKLRGILLALVVSASLAIGGIVIAANMADDGAIDSGAEVHGHMHGQHGGGDGHLAASSANVRVVGKMNVNQDFEGRVSDVGVFGNYAYLGAFNERDCQKGGVYVFDISKPSAPKQINFIRSANNSYVGEGVQIIRIDTPQYSGDVLVHNNEICGTTNTGAKGGISLVDVTNPKVHKWLAEGVGDFDPIGANGAGIAHEVHSAFAWDAGDKAYVVLVDNEEGADVDIMDISNPRSPALIAEYDLNTLFPQIIQADLGTGESFLHDMIVKQINGRWIMLLSYWDGGYVQLDVTNPLSVSYIADSDFAAVDPEALESGFSVRPEGNGHQAEFSKNNDYIVAADEDFSPYSVVAKNVTENSTFVAVQGSDTPQIAPGTALAGQTKYVGRACPGGPAVPPGNGSQVAVVERGDCFFVEKIAAVEAAGGYSGIIVFNREGDDGCSTLVLMDIQGGIPAIFVDRATGFALLNQGGYDQAACEVGDAAVPVAIEIGRLGDSVDISAIFDGWGYVHLYRNGTGKLAELDTYAIPEAHDPAFASGYGDLSVHEVAMSATRNELAYFAYYSGGFRVAKITGKGSNAKLVEAGHYIEQGGSNFWGVQLWQSGGKEYVLASDRDYGVYIFEYTGP